MKLNIDWAIVAEEIAKGDYSTRQELTAAVKQFSKLNDEHLTRELREKEQQAIDALRKLKLGAAVYYHGTDTRLLGKNAMKSKDGRAYMVVAIEGKLWRIPYKHLKSTPMSKEEVEMKTRMIRLLGG